MQREIIGVRYLESTIDGNNIISRIITKEVTEEISFNDIKPYKFYQLLVRRADGREYYLDKSWFTQNKIRDESLQRLLKRFDNEAELSPVKDIRVGEAYMVDAIQYDFHLEPTRLGYSLDNQLPEEDKIDYILTKPKVDYKKLCENSIVTVGGLAHRTSYGDTGLYIQGGHYTALQQKEMDIGILSFEQIGKVKQVDITRKNFKKMTDDLDHLFGAYLVFDKIDLDKYRVAMSLGGYLHFMDGKDRLLQRIGKHTIKLNMNSFNWNKRYQRIVKEISRDRLGNTIYDDKRTSVAERDSLETFLKFLDLSQTFLILIESDYPLMFERETLQCANYFKRYYTKENQTYPLRLGDGRFPSYMNRDEGKETVVATIENQKDYLFDTTAQTNDENFVTHYPRTTRWPALQKGEWYKISAIKVSKDPANVYEGIKMT